MKTQIGKIVLILISTLAAIRCQTAHADLTAPLATAYTTGGAWVNDPNGNSPFYSSGDLSVVGNFSNHAPPTPASGATASLLAETITITNGAGTNGLSTSLIGGTNYVLTGLSFLVSGYSTAPISVHIFDVTTNVNGGVTASGASYTIPGGDLLGAGAGLNWTNDQLSGAEQQVYLGLEPGPSTDDQIVLGANHIYAIEIWVSTSASGALNWYKSSAAPQDVGGEGMAGANTAYSASRISGAASGFYGSSQHSWALALYGYPTSAAPAVNSATNAAAVTNFVVDDFNSYGYGPTNIYVGANNYNQGQITNVWSNWSFATAFESLAWDPTSDADGDTNSGSLEITADYSGSANQFLVFDSYNGINPPINGNLVTNFQCDVRFAGSSPITTNSGVGTYGHLSFGVRTASYGQDYFGSVEVPAGNTNWVHVSIPINAATDTNLQSIVDVLLNIYGPYYSPALSGTTTLWIDNIKFVGPGVVISNPPPALTVQPAKPGLRLFAGDVSATYSREEIATTDQGATWVGGTYPVTYSFTLSSFPSLTYQGFQFHMFLVPLNYSPDSAYGNSFIEYDATNNFWLRILSGTTNFTTQVAWKTNSPSANPTNVVASVTTTSVVGTWTLQFSSSTAGTLTAPNGVSTNFTIPAEVAAEFAAPVAAYFGLQPNSTAAEGQFVDVAQITITNTAGNPVSDYFAGDQSLSGYWNNVSAYPASVVVVSTNNANGASDVYWVNWTLPATGYGLAVAPSLTELDTIPWMTPQYYNDYYDVPSSTREGTTQWTLVPSDCLPSVDGSIGGTPSPTGFFQLINPPPAN